MSKKKNKKEEEFKKLVDEEEIEEMAYDEDDDSYEVSYHDSDEFNLNNEVKALKILTCISICITIISLLISLVILSKVTGNTYSSGSDNTGAGSGAGNGSGGSQEQVEYDTSMFTEISIDDFMDMYKKDKKYFVYTGRATCGYCVAFLPTLQQSISEYDYTLYYLDVDKLSNDDLTKIAELHDDFADTIGGTPMVYVMGKKDVKDINRGYTEYSTYASFLEKNGIKKRK